MSVCHIDVSTEVSRSRCMFVNVACTVVDMTSGTPALKPSDLAGARVREARGRRRWTARELAERCAEAGAPGLTGSVIANIETGRRDKDGQRRRDITVDELLALAYALEVPPAALLAPGEGERIQITSKAEMGAAVALAFFSGRAPAPDAEQRAGWIDIAQRAMHHLVTSLDNDALSQPPADVRMHLLRIVDEAFGEVRHAVPWDRNGHAGERGQQPVIAAIVTSDQGVLIGRRNDRTPPWTFIAGWSEPGEAPADTIIREVKEEAGCIVKVGKRLGERVHPDTGRLMIYYAAQPTHGTEIHVGDEAELAEVRWVSLAEADELLPGMFAPVREYLAREIGKG
jgi:8-oxo-dGTP diphosphatase